MNRQVIKAARRVLGRLPTFEELRLPTRDALLKICGTEERAFNILYPDTGIIDEGESLWIKAITDFDFDGRLVSTDLVLGVREVEDHKLESVRIIGRTAYCTVNGVHIMISVKSDYIRLDYHGKDLTPFYTDVPYVRVKPSRDHVYFSVRLDLKEST